MEICDKQRLEDSVVSCELTLIFLFLHATQAIAGYRRSGASRNLSRSCAVREDGRLSIMSTCGNVDENR
jgi:hypothetical protein